MVRSRTRERRRLRPQWPRRRLGGVLGGSGSDIRAALLLGPLVGQCLREAGDLRRRRGEQARGLAEVGLHGACQLGQQDLARLQFGELVDLGDGQRATVHEAALDHQARVGLGEIADRLGRVDRLAGDERDRRGADEHLLETLDARVLRGPLDQRVLGDAIGRALAERTTQGRQPRHRKPAVLGDHRGGRAPELLGDLSDRRDLVGSNHRCASSRVSVGGAAHRPATPDTTNAPAQERTGRGRARSGARSTSSSCAGRPLVRNLRAPPDRSGGADLRSSVELPSSVPARSGASAATLHDRRERYVVALRGAVVRRSRRSPGVDGRDLPGAVHPLRGHREAARGGQLLRARDS